MSREGHMLSENKAVAVARELYLAYVAADPPAIPHATWQELDVRERQRWVAVAQRALRVTGVRPMP